jgi:hypothetical protein
VVGSAETGVSDGEGVSVEPGILILLPCVFVSPLSEGQAGGVVGEGGMRSARDVLAMCTAGAAPSADMSRYRHGRSGSVEGTRRRGGCDTVEGLQGVPPRPRRGAALRLRRMK